MQDLRCCQFSDTPTAPPSLLETTTELSLRILQTQRPHVRLSSLLAVQGRCPDNNYRKACWGSDNEKANETVDGYSFDHGLLPRNGSAGVIIISVAVE